MALNQMQQDGNLPIRDAQQQLAADGLPKEDVQRIYNTLAPRYRYWGWIDAYLFGVKRMRRRLFAQATGAVLDVACGTGENFAHLPQDCRITAVDLSPGMVAQAEQHARQLGRSIDVRVMDASRLDFPDNSFDTVTSAMSTCTFPDPIAALQEMKRVCRPNGRILLVEHGRSQVAWFGRYQDRTVHKHIAQAGCRWNQDPQVVVQAAGLNILSAKRHFFGVFHAIVVSPV